MYGEEKVAPSIISATSNNRYSAFLKQAARSKDDTANHLSEVCRSNRCM